MFFSISHLSRRRSCLRRHGFENVLRSSAVKSRSPLGMTQPGSRWNTYSCAHDGLDGGNDLRGRRARAHHRDDLVGEVVLVLPARGVELRALEVVEPRPVGVARDVQEPDAADEHVALVGGAVVEADRPHVAVVVPGRRLDRDPEAQVRAQPVLVDGLLEVLLQLGLLGVGAGPVVRLERVRVQVRADVDLGARVGVVPPRPADAERRLVDRERVDPGALHLHAGGDAAEARRRRRRPAASPRDRTAPRRLGFTRRAHG